ncbi:hypothetical protein SAMN04487925_10153 [Bradyrhizobium sp. cf659]|nr:hypothetical protein SAMN04487925_10153 [Bradyrhizobium sp. cf659]
MADVGEWLDVPDRISRSGFVFLQNWMPELSTDQALSEHRALRFEAASRIHTIQPSAEGTPNTYSGRYGLAAFPAHTDLAHWPEPPRYLWLRCLRGYDEVPTILFDGNRLIEQCGANLLSRSLVRARRPLAGRLHLMPLYLPSRNSAPARLRWDETYIVPASDVGVEGFTKMKAVIREQREILCPLSAPGDTLIIDNWRMLHARSVVPRHCGDRLIERAYLRSLH